MPFAEGLLRMVKKRNVLWVIKESFLSKLTKWGHFLLPTFKNHYSLRGNILSPLNPFPKGNMEPRSMKYPHVWESALLRNRWVYGLSTYKEQIGKYEVQLINNEADSGPLVPSRQDFRSIWLLSFISSFPLYPPFCSYSSLTWLLPIGSFFFILVFSLLYFFKLTSIYSSFSFVAIPFLSLFLCLFFVCFPGD